MTCAKKEGSETLVSDNSSHLIACFSFLVRFFFFRRNKKEKMNVTKIIRTLTLIDPESSSG